jgi:hypothetical protein
LACRAEEIQPVRYLKFGEITQSGAQLTARKLAEKAQTTTASEKPNYSG